MTQRARFERLALPHMDAAYTLAFWLLRSRSDAEDAVQDAYLRAYRGFSNFQGEDMRPWLLKIVRNVAYRKLGDNKRASNVIAFEVAVSDRATDPTALEMADGSPSPEDVAVQACETAIVKRALGELAPAHREVLVLREIEAMSYREIAELTGVPIGTVMSRLNRARGELRKIVLRLMTEGRSDAV
jgi:RNA polymerase sigma-70 factor (ECF subfamily)